MRARSQSRSGGRRESPRPKHETRHPDLVERFTPPSGELTVKRDGQTSTLRQGETAVVEPRRLARLVNASDWDALVRLEITQSQMNSWASVLSPDVNLFGRRR
jgi:glyoxylate utilization-related uncharacterized protein